MTDLRPATAADAAILALHHHRTLLETGWDEDAATRATQAFLPWARRELEAGRLIAVVAGGGLEAAGSVALHQVDRPASLEVTEVIVLHAPPDLQSDLVHAVLDEARLRGVTRVVSALPNLERFGFRASHLLEWMGEATG
jgi:3',5'-cyclic AMP phosphodiesterase CpdA